MGKTIVQQEYKMKISSKVMNDEANTHYFAMLDQLIEGHQFIAHKFGKKLEIVYLSLMNWS